MTHTLTPVWDPDIVYLSGTPVTSEGSYERKRKRKNGKEKKETGEKREQKSLKKQNEASSAASTLEVKGGRNKREEIFISKKGRGEWNHGRRKDEKVERHK